MTLAELPDLRHRHAHLRHGHERVAADCASRRPTCSRRAIARPALGYLATGSLFGLVMSPLVISVSQTIADRTGADPLGLGWYLLPCLILPGIVDDLLRATRSQAYRAESCISIIRASSRRRAITKKRRPFSAMSLLRRPIIRLAIVSNCSVQGNMSIVMVLNSLALKDCGTGLTAIAISSMCHSAGMFAFTIPLGKLTDRSAATR